MPANTVFVTSRARSVTSLSVTSLKRLTATLAFTAAIALSVLGAAPAWGRTSESVPVLSVPMLSLSVDRQAITVPGQSSTPTTTSNSPGTPSSAPGTTVLLTGPSPDEGGGVIPRPNSGANPQSSGDRGGWVQLTLWGLIVVGLGSMFGRIAWGMYKHSRANPIA